MDYYVTKNLEKELSDKKACVRKRGPEIANKIFIRISQIEAAETLEDMRTLPGRWHELKADRKGQIGADLIHPKRLIVTPAHNLEEYMTDGSMDWKKIKKLNIIEIGDYHG